MTKKIALKNVELYETYCVVMSDDTYYDGEIINKTDSGITILHWNGVKDRMDETDLMSEKIALIYQDN